jgi:hypothetical protein
MVDGGSHHEANEGTLVLIEDLRAHRDRQGASSQPPTPRPEPNTTATPDFESSEDPARLALGIAGGCQPNGDESLAQRDSPVETPPAAGSHASEEPRAARRSPDETLNQLDASKPSNPTALTGPQQASSTARRLERHAAPAGVRHPDAARGSALMGTAHLPKDTPTRRPKRQRAHRAQRQRDQVVIRAREGSARRFPKGKRGAAATTAALALTAGVLLVLAAMLANGSPARRDTRGSSTITQLAERASNPALTPRLDSMALLAEHAWATVYRELARDARTAQHRSRSRARWDPRTRKSQHSTAGPSGRSTVTTPTAVSAPVVTTSPPAFSASHGAASSALQTRAAPAGPTGQGAIVGPASCGC